MLVMGMQDPYEAMHELTLHFEGDQEIRAYVIPDVQEVPDNNEFKAYMKEPPTPMDQCPLLWWASKKYLYPNVARMARDYLVIPGSSVPSESIFSTGKQLITQYRHSLNRDSVRASQCLKPWNIFISMATHTSPGPFMLSFEDWDSFDRFFLN